MKKYLVGLIFAGTALGAAAVFVQQKPAQADIPFVAESLESFGAKVDFVIPAHVRASVPEAAAQATARAFTRANPQARVLTSKLGLYSDLRDRNILVWVVELDGLNMPAIGGGMIDWTAPAPRTLTRAVVLVSATDKDSVFGMFSSAPLN